MIKKIKEVFNWDFEDIVKVLLGSFLFLSVILTRK